MRVTAIAQIVKRRRQTGSQSIGWLPAGSSGLFGRAAGLAVVLAPAWDKQILSSWRKLTEARASHAFTFREPSSEFELLDGDAKRYDGEVKSSSLRFAPISSSWLREPAFESVFGR